MPAKIQISNCLATNEACPPLPKTLKGKRITVAGNNNCPSELDSGTCCHPAIPMQTGKSTAELRDGSVDNPIVLKCLQTDTGLTAPSIMIVQSDGTLVKWKPPQVCGQYKIKVNNGSFEIVEDAIPNILPATVCETTCSNVDFLLGAKKTILACPGQPNREMLQLFLVPKCCCTAQDISGVSI